MQSIVYLNGQFMPMDQAQIPVMDRGFLFGDAVYEVIPFYQGVGFQLEQHLQRLAQSLEAVGIQLALNWESIFSRLLELNPGDHQAIYLRARWKRSRVSPLLPSSINAGVDAILKRPA